MGMGDLAFLDNALKVLLDSSPSLRKVCHAEFVQKRQDRPYLVATYVSRDSSELTYSGFGLSVVEIECVIVVEV